MAVACNLCDDPDVVHPRYKQNVGYQLSRSDLAVADGEQVEFQGPIVQIMRYSTDGHTVNITYTAVSNIDSFNPNGFEVCCRGSQCSNDTLWIPSTVSGKSGLTITLGIPSACFGKQLYRLRYLRRITSCPRGRGCFYQTFDK